MRQSICQGAIGTIAIGINDNGQIVGGYADAGSPQCVTTLIGCHGFVLSNGVFTTIDFPGAATTLAHGINDKGQIVGQFLDATAVNRGFLLDNGIFTQIDAPNSVVAGANDINDRGQILGIFDDGPDPFRSRHGFLLDDGVFTQIDFPGGSSTSHVAMNDGGQIVGVFGVFQDSVLVFHGFLLVDGRYIQFDFPGALDTSAEGINDRGQIVGQYFTARPGLPRGFLLENSAFLPLDVPDSMSTVLADINDRGRIVGQFQDAAGAYHGFVAVPIPEPSTLLLLSVGALGLLHSIRKKETKEEVSENADPHLRGGRCARHGGEGTRRSPLFVHHD